MRTFVDSSTIIALAQVGELSLLRDLFGTIFITRQIEQEVTGKQHPETSVIESSIGDWVEVVDVEGDEKDLMRFGLGPGEASLFLLPKEDRLIIDDLEARRMAEAMDRQFSGLLGILVAANHKGILSKKKARAILKALADGDFRMSVGLYRKVEERLK